MPSEPIREQILAAVATRLATITTSTYWATPVLITRALLSIDHYKEDLLAGPVFGVTRATGSLIERAGHDEDAYLDHFRFTVECYVRDRGGVLAGTWLERSWQDHFSVLIDDEFLGGLVDSLRPDITETDDGALEPEAWFRQTWIADVARPS